MPSTPAHDSLKWITPFIDTLQFLEPVIKYVSKGTVVGIAAWKYQASSEEFQEFAKEYFRLMNKQRNIDEERTQLMKEIASTHKDLGFFLKLWRKSWEDAQDGK